MGFVVQNVDCDPGRDSLGPEYSHRLKFRLPPSLWRNCAVAGHTGSRCGFLRT